MRILRQESLHTKERYIRNLNEDLRQTYELLEDIEGISEGHAEQKGTKARHEKQRG